MRFQAPPRSHAACLMLAALLTLGGCGNRGELYLEPSLDAEAGLDALGGTEPAGAGVIVPGDDPGATPAAEPSPLVPGEGIAPTAAPALDPDTDEDTEDGNEEESGS